MFFFQDTTIKPISGKVEYLFNEDFSCGIENALIEAWNPDLEKTDAEALLTSGISNEDGFFEIGLPVNTQFRLTISYRGHTFIGNSDEENFILSEDGVKLTDGFFDLVFRDTTSHSLTVTAAITECEYDIGEFLTEVRPLGCPSASSMDLLQSSQTKVWELPAHRFSYKFKSGVADEALDKQFEYQFGKSPEFDLGEESQM